MQNASVARRIVLQQEPGFLTKLVEALSAEKQTELSSSVLEMAAWLEGLYKSKQNEATSETDRGQIPYSLRFEW